MNTILSRALGFLSPRANGTRQPPSTPPSLPRIEVLQEKLSRLPETPTKGPRTNSERMRLKTVARKKAGNAKPSSSRKTLDATGVDTDDTMSGAEIDKGPSHHCHNMSHVQPYKAQKGIIIADTPTTNKGVPPRPPVSMLAKRKHAGLEDERPARPDEPDFSPAKKRKRDSPPATCNSCNDQGKDQNATREAQMIIDLTTDESSLPTPADSPKRRRRRNKKKGKGKEKATQVTCRQRDASSVETERGHEDFRQLERTSVATMSGGAEQGQASIPPQQHRPINDNRNGSIGQYGNLQNAGDEDDVLQCRYPRPFDQDRRDWIQRTAEELDLTEDDFAVLNEYADQPSEDQITLLAALRMRHEPCRIPLETKRALRAEALSVLLSFNWPARFKSRASNLFRLYESLRGNPFKIGLDRSWILDPFKIFSLRTQALLAFCEARRQIKVKVKASVDARQSVKRLAQELGKANPDRPALQMAALLRRHYEAGRPDLFDRVDRQLSDLQKLSFRDAMRVLDQILTGDREKFPE